MKPKSNHKGRPPIRPDDPMTKVSIRIFRSQTEKFNRLGSGAWMRKVLDRTKMPKDRD